MKRWFGAVAVFASLAATAAFAIAVVPAPKAEGSKPLLPSAKPLDLGPQPFKFGNSGPSSGPNAASMLELLVGARLVFDDVNLAGGIKGRRIDLIQRDDNFEVLRTVANVHKLIAEDKVDALLLVRGTPHNEAILPIIDKAGLPLIGPSTGAMTMHEPIRPNVFNVRAPYRYEAQKLAELLLVLQKRHICVIHVDDSFGADVARGFVDGLKAAKVAPQHVHKFDRKTADMSAFLPTVKSANPDAIVLIGAGAAAASGVESMRKLGITAPVATVSNNASSGFVKALGKNAHGVMVSQVFPNEQLADYPVIREARGLAQRANVVLTPAMVEGFVAAKVAVEALRRCKGSCTRSDLHRSLEALNVDIGGLHLAYSPTDHTGVQFADLSIINRRGTFLR